MIVYNANKGQFVHDVRMNVIAGKILDLIKQRGLNAGQDREFAAWQNSMQFMRNIVDDPEIDDDVQIAIEYNIPQTSKRVDFIIIGANKKGSDSIVIVELKQWTKAEVVDDDMHFSVRTYVANNNRIVCHPSYQAYSYSRFIGNYSSGKMGFAVANECANRGAQVELVCGPVSASMQVAHPNIHRLNVESAQEMYEACIQLYPSMHSAILCAAVADYAPERVATQKMKRTDEDLVIRLKPNPDIAASLGKIKKEGQALVGFALETNDEETHAQEKLRKKNFDFIVLNSLKDEGAGFRTDTNKITILSAEEKKEFPLKSKAEVAKDIVDQLERL